VFVVVGLGVLSAAVVAQDKQPLTLRERVPLTGPEFSQPPTPPPQEVRNLMRANQRLLAVDNLSENAAAAAAPGAPGVTTYGGSIGKSLTPGKEDYEGITKDASALKENFAKIGAFFADLKSVEGVQLAKDGEKAAADLETAATAKDRVGAVKAQLAAAVACRNCHIAHRVLLITMPIQFGVIG
jgi:hypothetical protein